MPSGNVADELAALRKQSTVAKHSSKLQSTSGRLSTPEAEQSAIDQVKLRTRRTTYTKDAQHSWRLGYGAGEVVLSQEAEFRLQSAERQRQDREAQKAAAVVWMQGTSAVPQDVVFQLQRNQQKKQEYQSKVQAAQHLNRFHFVDNQTTTLNFSAGTRRKDKNNNEVEERKNTGNETVDDEDINDTSQHCAEALTSAAEPMINGKNEAQNTILCATTNASTLATFRVDNPAVTTTPSNATSIPQAPLSRETPSASSVESSASSLFHIGTIDEIDCNSVNDLEAEQEPSLNHNNDDKLIMLARRLSSKIVTTNTKPTTTSSTCKSTVVESEVQQDIRQAKNELFMPLWTTGETLTTTAIPGRANKISVESLESEQNASHIHENKEEEVTTGLRALTTTTTTTTIGDETTTAITKTTSRTGKSTVVDSEVKDIHQTKDEMFTPLWTTSENLTTAAITGQANKISVNSLKSKQNASQVHQNTDEDVAMVPWTAPEVLTTTTIDDEPPPSPRPENRAIQKALAMIEKMNVRPVPGIALVTLTMPSGGAGLYTIL